MALRIGVIIQQRQPDGSLVKVEFFGRATGIEGTRKQIAEMLLEAEMHGNAGKSRIHISVSEDNSGEGGS